MPTIDQSDTFRLTHNCLGVLWHDETGWHGCLRWDIEGDTNFVGPFASIMGVRNAVRGEFLACASPVADPAFPRGM